MAQAGPTNSAPKRPDQPNIRALLSPFFPNWGGEASEPALPTPTPTRPAPAARALVLA